METIEIITAIICFAGLAVLSAEDIKNREMSLSFIGIFAGCLVALGIYAEYDYTVILLGTVPGMIAIVISLVTRGKLGMGDALLLTAVGFGCGIEKTFEMWFVALVLCAVFGMVLIAIKKVTVKTALPFAPFLLAGYTICEIANIVA